ncbi:hypothetical protein ACQY0O_001856 [Thecaphora frezii]
MATKSTPTAPGASPLKPDPLSIMGEISSPHQLVDWVDTLLVQLENRFDEMSAQVEARMTEMSTRIDALENSIQDLISGTTAPIHSQPTGASNADD